MQARTGSTRLPGKVLLPLGGRPLLEFLLERLRRLRVDRLVVATSTSSGDDAIEELCHRVGVDVVRGSEEDVLSRFVVALDRVGGDHVVRITADCPLADPHLIAATIDHHLEQEADYTCNVLPRTYPQGLDVEVARTASLRIAADEARLPWEREHVTPFMYRHPERFRLAALRSGEDLGDLRWTVDTPDDLEHVRHIVNRLAPSTDFGWREVLTVADRPDRPKGVLRLRPAISDDAARVLAWRNDPISVATSRSLRPVARREHGRWYASVIADPGRRVYIGERDGTPLGMVRVDVEDAVGTVSVTVRPDRRREGIATEMLRQLLATVDGDPSVDGLVAEVRYDNEGSRRAFVSAGFRTSGRTAEWLHFEWQNPLAHAQEDTRA